MIVTTNGVMALMLKTLHMGIFEDNLKLFKKVKKEHKFYYNFVSFGMCLFGPNFAKLFKSTLVGVPSTELEKLSPY